MALKHHLPLLWCLQVEVGKDEDDLPLVYEPERIAQFWSRRPVAVATRVAQLLSIGSGFLSGLLWDLATGSFARNEVSPSSASEGSVVRTSQGPCTHCRMELASISYTFEASVSAQ